jgi:hypothetical protein
MGASVPDRTAMQMEAVTLTVYVLTAAIVMDQHIILTVIRQDMDIIINPYFCSRTSL